MGRGKNLTTEELGRAAKAYVAEGTFEAAGLAIGRDPSVVRRALERAKERCKAGRPCPICGVRKGA